MLTPDERNPENDATPSEDELMSQIGETLQRRADSLDADTRARLDQIRREAVAASARPAAAWFMQPAWGGALAACLLVAVALLTFDGPEVPPEISDFEMVLTNSDFEMLEQDLEFYAWLEQALPEDDA